MKVVAFAGSSSKESINKKLVTYASGLIKGAEIELLDLNDFEMCIYSIDKEKQDGIPEKAKTFQAKLKSAELILISLAEHNGSYSAAFKNIMDWKSRLEGKIWENKRMILLSTSPGVRGGASVLNTALTSFPFQGAEIVGHFSLPSFIDNFKDGKIVDERLNNDLLKIIEKI